jgi:pyruvate kinase
MTLPECRTKIIATVGPACDDPDVMRRIIEAGMDIARLNFSHGSLEDHARRIALVRGVARTAGRRVAIMADLPGPKMRIGRIEPEAIVLAAGEPFTLTTRDVVGGPTHASVTFERLPQVVHPGDLLYLNDGLVHLKVEAANGSDVRCVVEVGGELRSRKGLNLPGLDLGISAFTDRDREMLAFALDQGVDAVSQSFVEGAADIEAVRIAVREMGHEPFVIAKIERAAALVHADEIIEAADGIMVARGDLGVEIPIERIALAQKDLVRKANLRGRPVIAATQLLESMTSSRIPTRAEATDVANAVLDGADGLMLSGESAIGRYPVESVAMLARIAATIEGLRPDGIRRALERQAGAPDPDIRDLIAASVGAMIERFDPAAIVVPSRTGGTARSIARFRPAPWIIAVCPCEATCNGLHFSAGVHPVCEDAELDDWSHYVRERVRGRLVEGDLFMLAAGPSPCHPDANMRLEVVDLRASSAAVAACR